METSELLKKVRRIEIQTGRLVAETLAGEYQSVFKGQGMEFSEVREYVPGDDVRSIDWNVSARTGKTYVKKFLEERELTLIIACDVSASGNFGGRGRLKREIMTELAALFAFSALTNNDKAGLLLFSGKPELFIPPRKGKKHVLRIIRELLAFEPSGLKTDISAALDNLNKLVKRQGILVLISDFMDKNFEKSFRLSFKKFDLIPVLVRDALESKMPKIPLFIDARDPESGEYSFFKASSAPSFADVPALEKFFAASGADFIKVSTEDNPAEEVVKLFKKRARRLGR